MKRKIVYLEWQDPTSYDDWDSLKAIENKTSTIKSVGFLLHKSKQVVTIALNVDDDNGDTSQTLTIPMSIITKFKTLGRL